MYLVPDFFNYDTLNLLLKYKIEQKNEVLNLTELKRSDNLKKKLNFRTYNEIGNEVLSKEIRKIEK